MAVHAAKDRVPNVLTCARTAARKATGQETAEEQEEELRKD